MLKVEEQTDRQSSVAVSVEGGRILSFYKDAQKLYRGEMVLPRMVSVWLTHMCNLACSYCLYAWTHAQHKVVDPGKFNAFIDEIARLGIEGLEFAGGGEPALHPKCFEFAERASKLGVRVGMLTNGTRYDLARAVKYFSYIRIGIDAHTDSLYTIVKSPKSKGQFDVVVRNTEDLLSKRGRGASPKIGFKFLLGKKNYEYLQAMAEFSKGVGVDYAWFAAEHNSESELNEYERDLVEKTLASLKVRYQGFVRGSVTRLRASVPCFMAPIHTVMDAHGNLFVCCYFNVPEKNSFGNALDSGFEKVWFSEKHQKVQKSYSVQECDKFSCRWHSYNREMKQVLEENKFDLQFI